MPAFTTPTAKEHPEPTDCEVVEEATAIYPPTSPGGATGVEIAEEAYRIYLGRGSEHGRDLDDWLEAECRLSASNNRR
jgi:hypothetical protein